MFKKKIISVILISLLSINSVFGLSTETEVENYIYNELLKWNQNISVDYDKDVNLVFKEGPILISNSFSKNEFLSYSYKSYAYEIEGDSRRSTINIKTDFYMSSSEYKTVYDEVLRISKEKLNDDMSDFEKALIIHDFIRDNVTYDDELILNSPYDALIKKKSVCQGYALLYHMFLSLNNIDNNLVIGELEGVAHIWNLVSINGFDYFVDVTNDSVNKTSVPYFFFMVSSQTLKDTGFKFDETKYSYISKNLGLDNSDKTFTPVDVNLIKKSNNNIIWKQAIQFKENKDFKSLLNLLNENKDEKIGLELSLLISDMKYDEILSELKKIEKNIDKSKLDIVLKDLDYVVDNEKRQELVKYVSYIKNKITKINNSLYTVSITKNLTTMNNETIYLNKNLKTLDKDIQSKFIKLINKYKMNLINEKLKTKLTKTEISLIKKMIITLPANDKKSIETILKKKGY